MLRLLLKTTETSKRSNFLKLVSDILIDSLLEQSTTVITNCCQLISCQQTYSFINFALVCWLLYFFITVPGINGDFQEPSSKTCASGERNKSQTFTQVSAASLQSEDLLNDHISSVILPRFGFRTAVRDTKSSRPRTVSLRALRCPGCLRRCLKTSTTPRSAARTDHISSPCTDIWTVSVSSSCCCHFDREHPVMTALYALIQGCLIIYSPTFQLHNQLVFKYTFKAYIYICSNWSSFT